MLVRTSSTPKAEPTEEPLAACCGSKGSSTVRSRGRIRAGFPPLHTEPEADVKRVDQDEEHRMSMVYGKNISIASNIDQLVRVLELIE